MTIHRPPCASDQEHNVVAVIRQEVDAEYQQRFAHEREEEERLVEAERARADWAPGELQEAWGV